MEDIQFSLSDLIATKTGMKIQSVEKIENPLTGKTTNLVIFENGVRAYADVKISLQANGPLVNA